MVYCRTSQSGEKLIYDFGADEGHQWQEGSSITTLRDKNAQVKLGSYTLKRCIVYYCDSEIQSADDEFSVFLAPGIGYVDSWFTGGINKQNNKIDGKVLEF